MLTQLTPHIQYQEGLYTITLDNIKIDGELEKILDLISDHAEERGVPDEFLINVTNPNLAIQLSKLVNQTYRSAIFDRSLREDADTSDFSEMYVSLLTLGIGLSTGILSSIKFWELGKSLANYLSSLSQSFKFSEYIVPPIAAIGSIPITGTIGGVLGGLLLCAVHEGFVRLQTPDASKLGKYQNLYDALSCKSKEEREWKKKSRNLPRLCFGNFDD